MAPICMACCKPHAWGLVSPVYAAVCGECVENDPRVVFNDELDLYYPYAYCRCGEYGPVNYGRGDTEYMYYCNRSDRCIP